MAGSHVTFSLEFEEAPTWLYALNITRKGDDIIFTVEKTNGRSPGEVKMKVDRFVHMVDVLTSEGS